MLNGLFPTFICQWTVYGEEKNVAPTKLCSPFTGVEDEEGEEDEKSPPVEVCKEQIREFGRTYVRPYQPRPPKFFPEGPGTFWVGLFVDG